MPDFDSERLASTLFPDGAEPDPHNSELLFEQYKLFVEMSERLVGRRQAPRYLPPRPRCSEPQGGDSILMSPANGSKLRWFQVRMADDLALSAAVAISASYICPPLTLRS